MAVRKEARRAKLRKKIRSKISGTATKPRLSVFRSNKAIYAQVIDDSKGTTIAFASSATMKDKITKVDAAAQVGKAIAEKAITAGITEVVFDRGGYLYHGRIKSLADGAREGGLKF
jgi:large subunit ribosomal protein L18